MQNKIRQGKPYPLGATLTDEGFNFSLFSKSSSLKLCLFEEDLFQPELEIVLDPTLHRTGNVWHIAVRDLSYKSYSYRVENTQSDLIDPYAKGLVSRTVGITQKYSPLGRLPTLDRFDWEEDRPLKRKLADAIFYEMHVGGFTQHKSSKVTYPGTYLGVIEKIPYLLDLGINTVELLPVFEFNPREFTRCSIALHKEIGNYWGYSTVNFFSPANCYAVKDAAVEFCQMVKALHKAGIEVILDVVYNHTAEALGDLLSFNGFDRRTYYMIDDQENYLNFSGCGNTFNCNHPVARQLILDSLRYWASEMHVDGFRFDLASVFMRDRYGHTVEAPPLLDSITEDPLLSGLKLIAEPWDAAGLYQVGSFFPPGRHWSEWNGKYRDSVRRFIKGDLMSANEFAMRISGSEDLYSSEGGSAENSINFITCHDGFCLADLVSYNEKHNEINGESNRDGCNDNWSWNCGVEGETEDSTIQDRRKRQICNFLVALMVSRGVPMLTMGDECGHSKSGNNNTWCLNSEHNWLCWQQTEQQCELYHFFKAVIALRKQYSLLRSPSFYGEEVTWHGTALEQPNWDSGQPLIALSMEDEQDHLYIAFNATSEKQTFSLPVLSSNEQWVCLIDTESCDLTLKGQKIESSTIVLNEWSSSILRAERV